MTPAVRSLLLAKPKTPARFGASFASASSQNLTVANDTRLQAGNFDFLINFWGYLAGKSGAMTFVGKRVSSANSGDYTTPYDNSADRLLFAVFDGSSINSVTASSFGSPPLTTWFNVTVWHNVAAGTINIRVNAGTVNSAALTLTPTGTAATFALGSQRDTPAFFLNGRIAGVVVCKPPTAGGDGSSGTLANSIAVTLYNAGRGRDPRSLTSAERSRWGVVFAPDFPALDASTCPELINGLALANNNGVTNAAGPGG